MCQLSAGGRTTASHGRAGCAQEVSSLGVRTLRHQDTSAPVPKCLGAEVSREQFSVVHSHYAAVSGVARICDWESWFFDCQC